MNILALQIICGQRVQNILSCDRKSNLIWIYIIVLIYLVDKCTCYIARVREYNFGQDPINHDGKNRENGAFNPRQIKIGNLSFVSHLENGDVNSEVDIADEANHSNCEKGGQSYQKALQL
jgi:hypothetical protein